MRLIRNSPDDSQTGVNDSNFLDCLEARREVRTLLVLLHSLKSDADRVRKRGMRAPNSIREGGYCSLCFYRRVTSFCFSASVFLGGLVSNIIIDPPAAATDTIE